MITASRRRDTGSSHTGCRLARRLEPDLDAVDNTSIVVESIDDANSDQRKSSYDIGERSPLVGHLSAVVELVSHLGLCDGNYIRKAST